MKDRLLAAALTVAGVAEQVQSKEVTRIVMQLQLQISAFKPQPLPLNHNVKFNQPVQADQARPSGENMDRPASEFGGLLAQPQQELNQTHDQKTGSV
jgi:hypothetical protein